MLESPKSHPPGFATTVATLLSQPEVARITELVVGAESLDRPLDHPRIQKSGLVLVGHRVGLVPTRVQILGETEVSFLESMSAEERLRRCVAYLAEELSLMVITRGARPPEELIEAARRVAAPLVVAKPRSSRSIQVLHSTLDRLLAPSETRHGVLIDVHGIGTLLVGPSGIGKSECALFLLDRGHRLVADDQVVLTRTPEGALVGRPPPLLRHHLELRGVGILNVRDLFGATAVRDSKIVQMVVELQPVGSDAPIERLGLDDDVLEILGSPVPLLRIPVQPGRNMAVLLEVAARNQLLKKAGHHAARSFVDRLHESLRSDSSREVSVGTASSSAPPPSSSGARSRTSQSSQGGLAAPDDQETEEVP